MADRWTAPIGRLNSRTSDNRIVQKEGFFWRTLPLPLGWQEKTAPGHDDAVTVGVMDTVSIAEDGITVLGAGTWLDQEVIPDVAKARELVRNRVVYPSMEPAGCSIEWQLVGGGEGAWDEDGYHEPEDIEEVMVFTTFELAKVTLVAVQAFPDLFLTDVEEADEEDTEETGMTLVATAGSTLPPRAWFDDPQLTGPTPLTITDDGRVYGHCATWGTCHVGLPGCVTPPVSYSQYAYFTVGATLTDGGEIPTGKLTVGGGHADGQLGYAATAEHYDNACTAVATVTAGEDEYGIWVAGAVLAAATEEQVEALRQSPLSGDWRSIGGNLELVAAHAVNVPGFPVPRARAVVADAGRQLSLVASARFDAAPVEPRTGPETVVAAAPERTVTVLAFNPGADDLREEMQAAGLEWPTISMTVGDRSFGPYAVAEGCVRGMFGATTPVLAAAPPAEVALSSGEPAAADNSERQRARARLALSRKGN